MDDRFRSYITRYRDPEPRVHTELNRRARERLTNILDYNPDYPPLVFTELATEVGESELLEQSDAASIESFTQSEFVENAETKYVWGYIEHYVRICIEDTQQPPLDRGLDAMRSAAADRKQIQEMIRKIEDVLLTEGLLFDLERIDDGSILFHPMESEAMEESDKSIQALAEEEPWEDALQGYNDAFERWKSGDYDELIPKKLYNSIEEVLKTICVDLEGWTDNRTLSHSEYLQLLRENGVYDAHGATADELGDLLNSLERMVGKVGGDRKQRHAYHDRTYATLLIHQVGAYIYFLISRYESFKGE